MINWTQLATLLMGAMLFARVFCGGFDVALADPVATSREAAGAVPKASPAAPSTSGLDKTSAIFAQAAAPVAPPAADQPAKELRGRAYLFRGALGPIFSRGMDRLTERIERAGVTANVYEFTICPLIAQKAIREYRQDPAPIILIGHSMGGLCGLKFSETLQAEGIPVSLLVTIDAIHGSPNVPPNVERYINLFLSDSVLGGGDVMPPQGYQGHYASFDLAKQEDVTHINIDKMDLVHEQLVTKILQLAVTPAKAEGEALPLRYIVPPNSAIELWDSGMPVVARPGDTLVTLAALYHVPLWSLTQINQESESTPLIPGQRVVVPRHLVPPTTAASRRSPTRR
jgi:hypothetical protein